MNKAAVNLMWKCGETYAFISLGEHLEEDHMIGRCVFNLLRRRTVLLCQPVRVPVTPSTAHTVGDVLVILIVGQRSLVAVLYIF